MNKQLIIAEKPSVTREFVSVLGKKFKESFTNNRSYYESDSYIITHGFGHLLRTKEPTDYEEFGGWNWNSLPFYPPSGSLDYIPGKNGQEQQLAVITKLLKRKDISLVINACDAEREGELIFWEIYHYKSCKHPVKRAWIKAMTEKDILEGLSPKSLRDESFYLPRKEEAYARQYADWALGQNLTTGYSVKVNIGRVLHIGRVQTPTLALIVQRFNEIQNFVSEPYFEIVAEFGGKYKGTWFKGTRSETKISKKEDAASIVKKINNQSATVTTKNVEISKTFPHPLFNLTGLSREANKKFGLSAKKTLDVAQLLYERYKAITYPRSDSKYLPNSIVSDFPEILNGLSKENYGKYTSKIIEQNIPTSKRFVDDKKVSDHHAIIPTTKSVNPNSFKDESDSKGKLIATKKEINQIFDLITRRFLAAFYPPSQYEKTEITTTVENETFKTNGKILVDAGWEEVYGKDAPNENEEKNEEDLLPNIEDGEQNNVTNSDILSKKTKPPKLYDENSLLGVMENPHRSIDEGTLKDLIAETGASLGTEATRAATIEKLIEKNYVERKGKMLSPTSLGIKLIAIAPDTLTSPEITADWEKRLKDIAKKEEDRKTFEKDIREFVETQLQALKESNLSVSFADEALNKPIGTCPICKKDVMEWSKVFACASSNREERCFLVFKTMAKKSISKNQVVKLLTDGKTDTIKGFKTTEGNSFEAKLAIINGEVKFDFPPIINEEMDISCPKCNGKMFKKNKVYACENDTREKNCFVLFREISKREISEDEATQLITKGETGVLSGFWNKEKKPYAARLYLNDKKDLSFDYKNEALDHPCPFCGGDVTESLKAFGCTNRQNGCSFTIWKTVAGKKITNKTANVLLKDGKTKLIKGFKGKKNSFDAMLVINKENKKIEFEFPPRKSKTKK